MIKRHPEYQYLDLLKELVEKGVVQTDKGTGVKTYSKFGAQMRFDLSEGFPLLTTKKVWWKGVVAELYWFLSGQSNIKYLVDNEVHIWDDYPYKIYREKMLKGKVPELTKEEFIEKIKADKKYAEKYGELPRIYGELWRRWPAHSRNIDQVKWALKEMKKDPDAHNLIVTSWNPEYLYGMAKPEEASRFPVCHNMYQLNVKNGRLCLHLYQRSADIFLGVPFNIASYALLTLIFAKVMGYKPGEFIHTFGDVHIYENHFEQAKEQLKRKPKKFPTVTIDPKVKTIDGFRPKHAILENYDPHPTIKAELTVSGGYFAKGTKAKKIKKTESSILISMIVAVDEKLGIGKNNRMPWNIPEDKNWFKEKTMGHVVIMGKNTFDSIVGYLGKPLPGRTNIVITSQVPSNQKKEAYFAKTLKGALTLAKKLEKKGEVFFIGGARLYASAINLVERLYVTEVTGKYDCDTFFPNYSSFSKELYSKAGKSGKYRFKFRILER